MENTAVGSGITVQKKAVSLGMIRWPLIGLFLILNLVTHFLPAGALSMTLNGVITLVIFATAILHSYERHGIKNSIVFVIVTWVVSNGLEALSIQTGFPFGHYYYTVPTARILNVPWIIMVAYFAMGYMSWTLAHVLTGQYTKKLHGVQVFLTPLIASFLMVMWDVVMDPVNSTLNKNWIWKDGGNYFGVPISNYFGWFFVVFVFFQIFALYLSKFDTAVIRTKESRSFFLEAAAVYGIQSLSMLLTSAMAGANKEIFSSTGLVNVFTMLFVTILSVITVLNCHGTAPAEERTKPDGRRTPAPKEFAKSR
jgi:Predicted membrane protein